MKKLRLLFTKDCNRSCPGYCNKDWNLDALKQVKHFNYDEILITGGEPLLYPKKLIGYIQAIRAISKAKIYIYTALTVQNRTFKPIYDVIKVVDGITLTLHVQMDIQGLKHVLYSIKYDTKTQKAFENKSLRLNVFKGIDISELDLSDWVVQDNMVWVENCPLPKDEVFLKI